MLNFSVFFGAKRFRENSKSPEIISEKVRLGGRKHFFVWNFLWFYTVLAFFSGLFDYIVLILAGFPMHKLGVKVVHEMLRLMTSREVQMRMSDSFTAVRSLPFHVLPHLQPPSG